MTTPYVIPAFTLNERYFLVHKTGVATTGFGLDHTPDLIGNGFGLYSCVNLRDEIGPLKSDFYRVALCFRGSLNVQLGLENFWHGPNTIHFHGPNQPFMFSQKSHDLEAYYLMVTPAFLEDILPENELKTYYPFFDYQQIPFFAISEDEMQSLKALFITLSKEVMTPLPDQQRSIKLLLNLLFITAKRSYLRQGLTTDGATSRQAALVRRFRKLVGQYFITHRTVNDYADQLAVSTSHLNKLVKEETGQSPGQLIDAMLLMEIKALLRHSDLTVSEIAYQLRFTDTSHLAKFFKKQTGLPPSAYRNQYRQLR